VGPAPAKPPLIAGAGPTAAPIADDVDRAEDPRIARALAQATKVLDAGVAVLVTGETGVGKEVFTRRLHAASRRREGPLVIVNCAALPENLIESELFGYEEGAFTGARRQGAVGRIREAAGGTLMLDEIGDMPLALQTRLLRVLEDRNVQPLGGGRAVRVDFQLVCATHCDLAALAEAGRFRSDLMFRIDGYEARLPSLRERQDKEALIQRVFGDVGGRDKRLVLGDDALDTLWRHAWPGNVRELVNVLRTLVALADAGTEVGRDALPARLLAPPASMPHASAAMPPSAPAAPLADVAQQAIEQALRAAAGNVARAAAQLGVHRSTIYRHLRRASRSC
ncbi:MAG: sigma-54-dependent Fis family transcriptional regulator, partial [Variovorax sp.]